MLANASPSDKLSKRLQAIFAQASISRRDMLGAMIGAGMNIATSKYFFTLCCISIVNSPYNNSITIPPKL